MQKFWQLLSLVLAILVVLALTCVRSYHLRLDGDIAPIVWPRADYVHILHDPFGWDVLTRHSIYAGPNRFFAHAAMVLYFRHVPLWLQAVASPINSLYLSTTLFSVGTEVLLLYVMGWYATGTRRLGSVRLWLAMALMLPFFQTTGYNRQMAIMDNAVTYNFFYPFPLMLLLVLLWPMYRAVRQGQPVQLAWWHLGLMLLLGVVLAFNGPIITGTVLILLLGVGLRAAWQRRHLPATQWLRGLPWRLVLLWAWLGLLSLYSLYIGRNNTENITTSVRSLSERYELVPDGVWHVLTARLGLPLLILACLANVQLVRRLLLPAAQTQRLTYTLRWLGLFALVYLLLLPLGGYRPYRAYILHHDLLLPITAGLVMFYGLSATYLLAQLRGRPRQWYAAVLVVIAAVYLNADWRLYPEYDNRLERQALALLAAADARPVVHLPKACTVLSWDPITEPLSSITSAEMLEYWHVTSGRKLYYCPPAADSAR
ncbi:MAG: hypothetical protein ACRYFZ_01895 [Janthinobacterium lividum]